jgi:hypothetical protein
MAKKGAPVGNRNAAGNHPGVGRKMMVDSWGIPMSHAAYKRQEAFRQNVIASFQKDPRFGIVKK